MTPDSSTPTEKASENTTLSNPSPPAGTGPKINSLRSSVRPIVTFALVAALVAAFGYLIWRFSTAEIASKVIDAVLILTASIVSFWFASRTKTN